MEELKGFELIDGDTVEEEVPHEPVVQKDWSIEKEYEMMLSEKEKEKDYKLLIGKALSGELRNSKLRFVYWLVKSPFENKKI